MFAEVALPLNVGQTFTYSLPGHMAASARPGSRVIVPFGKKLQTAFIVGIHEHIDDELRVSIKDVEELLDESPVVHADILELTKWMADYYYAPWGECLRSALPAGTLAVTEKLITITEAGRTAMATQDPGIRRSSIRDAALELIAQSGTISSRELEQQAPKIGTKPASISALIRRLERAGFVHITQRVRESRLRPRLQNVVRLVADGAPSGGRLRGNGSPERDSLIPDPEPGGGTTVDSDHRPKRKGGSKRKKDELKPLSDQQQRIVDQLTVRGDPVPLGELLEAAGTSVSAGRTLERRGVFREHARA